MISPEAALYPEESLPDSSILAVNLNGKNIVRISPSGGKPEVIFHTDFESDGSMGNLHRCVPFV